MRILVVRNDKIGDFMLAWPAFAMLKASMPCHITALVPAYTQILAELCPYIDEVIVDCGTTANANAQKQLAATLAEKQFDASICYYSTLRNACLMRRAKITQRWAPATKIFQYLYNYRLVQRRSQSAKAESEYNEDLSRAFLKHNGAQPLQVRGPYLTFSAEELCGFKRYLAQKLGLDESKPWLAVHVGSGGSASNLTVEQFAELAEGLKSGISESQLILTMGPEDKKQVTQLLALLKGNAVIADKLSLIELCKLLACVQLFMAGSTGPLHIAGALDTPTVGFYSNRLSAIGRRWRPINTDGRHLGFQSEELSRDAPTLTVKTNEVVKDIICWWRTIFSKFLSD